MLNELCQEGLESLEMQWIRAKDLPLDIHVYDTLVYLGHAERKIENYEKPYRSYIYFKKS